MINKLDDSFEEIIDLIVDGNSLRVIAKKYDVTLNYLHRFINRIEHSARTAEALTLSATAYADKGEEVLLNATGTKEELMRARELAQHYRWQAANKSCHQYGSKVEHNHGGQNGSNPIQTRNEHRFIIEDMTDGSEKEI